LVIFPTICLGWLQTELLLISSSQVGRMTGVRCLVKGEFFFFFESESVPCVPSASVS
jgi:hypothetical protein